MCVKFQPDPSAFFTKEINGFISPEICAAGLRLPKATKVADESVAAISLK
jgi:hypothetical protein